MPMTTPNHHANTHDVAGRGAKPLILVVDDSNVARTFIRLIFQNDFEVHEASSGAEALEMLRTGAYNYSAILLDLVMPEEDDGWAVLKFLRESGIIKTVPVVVETASAIDLEIVTELYESGAWKVVGKPFDGKMLLALVKAACERAGRRRYGEDRSRQRPLQRAGRLLADGRLHARGRRGAECRALQRGSQEHG